MIRPYRRDHPETYFESRFGIPRRAFSGYIFFTSGKGNSVWLAGREALIPGVEPLFVGMRCLRLDVNSKPTSAFLQHFGRHATRNVVSLGNEEAEVFLAGGEFEADLDASSGYVACGYRGDVLGCGLYERGVLRSRLPKGMRRDVDKMEF